MKRNAMRSGDQEHVVVAGQLTMLRRVAGMPVRAENYARAEIARGRVGADQPVAKVEFD